MAFCNYAATCTSWTMSGTNAFVADVKATQRKQFWAIQASKRQAGPKVAQFRAKQMEAR